MRLINADKLKVNLDQKFSFGLENKIKLFDEIDNTEEFDLEEHDKKLLSEFIKYFDEKSDFDIIHNDEYGEYQPSRHSLKDIYENFLEILQVCIVLLNSGNKIVSPF